MSAEGGAAGVSALFLLRRSALFALVLVAVTFTAFASLNLLGDPLFNIVGPLAELDCTADEADMPESIGEDVFGGGAEPSDTLQSDCEIVARARAENHLDKPMPVRYLRWAGNMLRGDLGWSFQNNQPVSEILREKLPDTLLLLLMAQAFALGVAIPWGVASAYWSGRGPDRASTLLSYSFLSVPSFALGVVVLYLFALRWQIFPSAYESGSLPVTVFSLLLPALTLGLPQAAVYQQLLRSDLITTLQEDYMLMAHAKGLPPAWIMLRHALRPSMTSLVTVFGVNAGAMITGSFAIERIFGIPGIGREMIIAVIRDDFPVVLGIVVVITVGFVMLNFIVDTCYGLLDPRVRVK